MTIIQSKEPRALNDWSFARIAYASKLVAASDSNVAAALIPNTWERWTSASGSMIGQFAPPSPTKINYVAIAAHNLFTAGASSVTIRVSRTVNANFFAVGVAQITSNAPLLFEFPDELNIIDVQVVVNGGANREIGVVYAGELLVMCRGLFGGHSPITLSSVTEYRNSTSDSGQFLGRNIRRKGLASQFSWQNIPDDWYRQYFQPFVNSAKTRPFFIQWRPDYYSNEVAFGYTTGDISPSNQSGIKRMMAVNFAMRAHDE